MKTLGPLCALAALVACSESESPTSKVEATAKAAWMLEPGTYEYTRADVSGLLVLAEDGAYTDVMSGGDLGTGRWGQERGLSCLQPADGDAKLCYTFNRSNAGGRFIGTATDGSKMTTRKLE